MHTVHTVKKQGIPSSLHPIAASHSFHAFPLESRARALRVVLNEEFGAHFRLYDAQNGKELHDAELPFSPSADNKYLLPPILPVTEVLNFCRQQQSRVLLLTDHYCISAIFCTESGFPVLLAQGLLPSVAGSTTQTVTQNATETESTQRRIEQERLQRWLLAVLERIRVSEELAQQRHYTDEQVGQVKRAWSVILGLDETIRQVKFHRDAETVRQRILRATCKALGCEACLWIPHTGAPLLQYGTNQGQHELIGNLASLCSLVPLLEYESVQRGRTQEPILWNENQLGRWITHCPQVRNLLAVRISKGNDSAWLLALNKIEGDPRFRTADAAILYPFASLIKVHQNGEERFSDLRDLLIGLTRSLTAAIDAKDSYTFGHSERVARLGFELGRELGLSKDDQSDIYLAGLLHDIGKIGIRDSVLQKPTSLTPEEFEHVKEHPLIGFKILADIKQLRKILPGVRNHHERWDGHGYPDQMVGEQIPLIARILAIVDAFDAMSMPRAYRQALPLVEVERRLQAGSGKQWDPWVVAGFMRLHREKLLRQEKSLSLGQALDSALRTETSSRFFPVQSL